MPSDAFKNLDPDHTVKVLPRYLAGPGPADVRTAWPFPFEDDWSLHQPEDGPVIATSPCLRLRTGHIPDADRPRKARWITAAHRDPFGPATWQITFDGTPPIELLHDLHTELLDLYLEDQHSAADRLFEDDTAAQEAYIPLLARGWSHHVETDGTQHFRDPQSLGVVQHQYARPRPTSSPTWTAWAGYPSEPYWRASFSTGVPTTLAAAFTASLISTEPVQRTVKDVPFHTRRHLYFAAQTTPANPHRLQPIAAPPPGPASSRTR